MSLYLDTRGRGCLAVGVCDRCHMKYPLEILRPDPNATGIRCCPYGCLDLYDPYRLPARAPDQIAVRFARPDAPLGTNPDGFITEDGDSFLLTENGDEYLVL